MIVITSPVSGSLKITINGVSSYACNLKTNNILGDISSNSVFITNRRNQLLEQLNITKISSIGGAAFTGSLQDAVDQIAALVEKSHQVLNPNLQIGTINPMMVGDADQLLSYTSDSAGAVTYSSSDDTVGSIVGSDPYYLRALKTGSITVTASQVASGSYTSGTSESGSILMNFLDQYKSLTKAAWSTTQLFSDATNCLRIRRSSDNAQQDFGFVNYVVDSAGISAFIGGGDGFIVKAYDQSGNSHDFAQATTGNQPKVHLSAQNGVAGLTFDGTASFLQTPSFFGASFNHAFTSINLSSKLTNSFKLFESIAMNSGFYYAARNNDGGGTDQLLYNNSGFTGGNSIVATPLNNNAAQILQETFTYNGTQRVLYCNTIPYAMIASTENMDLTGPAFVGNLAGSGFEWNGDMFASIYMQSGLSASDVRRCGYKLGADFGLIQKPYLMFEGNSLTAGVGSTGGLNYPQQTVTLVGSSNVTFLNQGAGGASTEDLITLHQTANIHLTNGFCTKLLFIFWEVTNSMYKADSGTTAYNVQLPYFAFMQALGYKIVLLNCLPRADWTGTDPNAYGVTKAQWDVQQPIANGLMLANQLTICDKFANVVATVLTTPGDPTYWSDGVHLNNAGYAIIANIVAPLVNQLIA